MISAVLWDFGGVVTSSPFEAFRRYEEERGLPPDLIRSVNTANPHGNAWARLERSEITPTEFDRAFAEESASFGHRIPGADVLALLAGQIRPTIVRAIERVKAAGYATACLTNNVRSTDMGTVAEVMDLFDAVVESALVGARKPEPRFYEIACEKLGVRPEECVFLDDLGINLKPAAAMGMTTIKVTSAEQAIDDLEHVLGIALRG